MEIIEHVLFVATIVGFAAAFLIPPDATLANGAQQGKNDFGKLGYGGPAPPRGKPHRYFFKMYALDAKLKLPAGATKEQLLKAMQGHVLAEAHLMGKYQR